jgi:hypothetical protein
MSSKVDIANQALALLGALPIVSLDDDTTEANLMKTMYEPTKQQLLRSYPWRCATRTATLAKLADAPVNTYWEFQFTWPEDAIHMLRVYSLEYPHNLNNMTDEWESVRRTVLTHKDNVAADYIYDIPEPDMDAHVSMVLAAQLAMDCSYALVGSGGRETQLVQLYDRKLQEARTTDRQEASHKTFRIDTLSIGR